MDSYRTRAHVALALLLILSVIANQLSALTNQIPSHVSWTSNNTRFDFVFSADEPITNLVKLETDANNYLTNSLANCTNHSACFFKNGSFVESFNVNNSIQLQSLFTPVSTNSLGLQCDTGNQVKIAHHCDEHWNPPVYVSRKNRTHLIDWHSPLGCTPTRINHERPCYIYDPTGKLVNLTAWILNNGSSHLVGLEAADKSKIKDLRVNVCNEAYKDCGPNISSCYIDEEQGMIESGYNNLTSITYDMKEKAVLLTLLGHYKPQCEEDRIRTVIRFACKKKSATPQKGPKLIRHTACENIIELTTIKACPLPQVINAVDDCMIRNETASTMGATPKTENSPSAKKEPIVKKEEPTLKMNDPTPKMNHPEPKMNNPTPKMNSFHKYFMIILILVSFVAFIVVIFVLDRKTKLRVTLGQARQAFPYSRVVNDLDL